MFGLVLALTLAIKQGQRKGSEIMYKYQLTIEPNQGYGVDQTQTVTVRDLLELLEGLDKDAEICTYDYQNRYGAQYGGLTLEIEQVEVGN
jgi:hypothetical protein